jgi:hypothetical protein
MPSQSVCHSRMCCSTNDHQWTVSDTMQQHNICRCKQHTKAQALQALLP